MKVIDHEPHAWFLLTDRDQYCLDARVTRSLVDWSVLIELNEQERCEFHANGRSYLSCLAARIHNRTEDYADRDLTRTCGDEALRAIREWRISSCETPQSCFVYDRMGNTVLSPSDAAMFELLGSLSVPDPEHPDVSLNHESGWSASVYESGRVVLENVETGEGPWHMQLPSTQAALELWRLLARGQIVALQSHPWVPGYGA